MEETKYESKFQLCSSSSLGDMPILVTEIKNWKGDRYDHLFVRRITHSAHGARALGLEPREGPHVFRIKGEGEKDIIVYWVFVCFADKNIWI